MADTQEKESIFTKKSLERISSPEQLNDYIKVASPGVWICIMAVIVLLLGAIVWGFFGKLESVTEAEAFCQDGQLEIYMDEAQLQKVKVGMQVRIDGKLYQVEDIAKRPVEVDESFDDYFIHASNLEKGEWVYRIEIDERGQVPEDGVYAAQVITDSVNPISFITD